MPINIEALPEECLVYILSLTSPEDILRSSAASKKFNSAAVSDVLWKKFLPSDYDQIISESSSPLQFDSLKDLFFILYRNHILIYQNTKSCSLDRRSWKKCYMLGSRSLEIIWGDNPECWSWISVPISRFPQNAYLDSVCWLHIQGLFATKLLSQNTHYGAYFVFKLTGSDWTGFQGLPILVSLSEIDKNELHLHNAKVMSTNSVYLDPTEESDPEEEHEEEHVEGIDALRVPSAREDGWMEIQMGTYQVGITQSETVFLEMTLRQTDVLNWKSGLLVHSIELRPLIGLMLTIFGFQ